MRRKIPSTQALVCFDAAARHESFSRAAQELALTQGAVSRQIAALEEFLSLTLFRRTRHGVALTAQGRDYARQVGRRLDGLELDTQNAMSSQGSGGALVLAAVPSFATRWLLPRLPGLAALHPDIVVHIETRTRPFLFADHAFDAALYAGTAEQLAQWPGTRALPLLVEEVVPVCSPRLLNDQAPLAPQAIAQLPLLQQSTRPDAWRQWFEAMDVDAAQPLRGPRYELFWMSITAAACGMGVALVPRILVADELQRGSLVIACDRPLRAERSYYLVQPETDTPAPALAAFEHWLQGQAEAASASKDL